ncbi:MAG: GTPase HflX [Clostridiales bacterium]|nr:GTPase HflX [Clostridiales bacterium]
MAYSNEKQIEKAVLVGIIFRNKEDVASQLKELERLAETAGVQVVGQTHQLIREVTPATLIGEGKVEEVKTLLAETGANLVIVDYELSGSQCKNLSDILEVKVIDRITLILDIFAGRAISGEGKLQVELAQLKYNLPRLSSIKGTSGRFGGGVGMRGPGETKLELDKRIAQENIYKLEKEIAKIKQNREVQKKNRNTSGVFKVAIVGYTNAGKSTLLNLISKAGIYADDKLFATLDTTSRNVFLDYQHKMVLTDTVGFISKLPHNLVDAFSSTLEEAVDANLILHVIDASNVDYKKHIEVVDEVLEKTGITAPVLKVYNKCDKLETQTDTDGIYISAKQNIGIAELKQKIMEFMDQKM